MLFLYFLFSKNATKLFHNFANTRTVLLICYAFFSYIEFFSRKK
jgi:hypothetical protein